VRAVPSIDHNRVFGACLRPLPTGWNRPGRPRYTWLRTLESDLGAANIGLGGAYHCAEDREVWTALVGTSMSNYTYDDRCARAECDWSMRLGSDGLRPGQRPAVSTGLVGGRSRSVRCRQVVTSHAPSVLPVIARGAD